MNLISFVDLWSFFHWRLADRGVPYAELHAEELTKAREGYLPTSEVDAKIAEMTKRCDETYKSWESSKVEAAELKAKYDDLKLKADREKEM